MAAPGLEEGESAEEGGRGGMEEETRVLCKDMFERVSEYLSGELASTEGEYQLLRRLNQITLAKYADMTALAGRLNQVAGGLNDKCECCVPLCPLVSLLGRCPPPPPPPPPPVASLQPYCEQIDQVEGSVSALEQTAYRLDAYCKRLGEAGPPNMPCTLTLFVLLAEAKFKEIEKKQ